MAAEKFASIKIHLKNDGISWSIVGIYPDKTFKILGVLDTPIDQKLVREITRLIALRFGVGEITED